MRSLAIQKNLPRPLENPQQLYSSIYLKEAVSDVRREAEMMLEAELLRLLAFDKQSFRIKGAKVHILWLV